MQARNKNESFRLMNMLGVNRVPEVIVKKEDIKDIKRFFEANEGMRFVMRDNENPQGKYFFVSSYQECLENAKNYAGNFSIAVSFNSFGRKVLLGDIKVSGNNVDLTARTDQESSHRNIHSEPQIALHTTLVDEKIWRVPGFEKLMSYIVDYRLYDVIVEFVVFENKVGIKDEEVLIVEIRSQYWF